jgi:hypothetical protein
MMNIKYTSVLCVALLSALCSNVCVGQMRTAGGASATFQQGGWTKADDPLSPFICQCNGGSDCICALIAYCGTCKPGGQNTFTLAVRSQNIVGNSLRVTFANVSGSTGSSGIPASIKHTDFTQKNEVKMDAAAAAALGYTDVTILPGKYSLKNNSLLLVIHKGKPLPKKN